MFFLGRPTGLLTAGAAALLFLRYALERLPWSLLWRRFVLRNISSYRSTASGTYVTPLWLALVPGFGSRV